MYELFILPSQNEAITASQPTQYRVNQPGKNCNWKKKKTVKKFQKPIQNSEKNEERAKNLLFKILTGTLILKMRTERLFYLGSWIYPFTVAHLEAGWHEMASVHTYWAETVPPPACIPGFWLDLQAAVVWVSLPQIGCYAGPDLSVSKGKALQANRWRLT